MLVCPSVRWLVRPSVRLLVCPSVGSHDEILQRGEGRGCGMMSKTGYVEIASRLVTVTRSLFLFWRLFLTMATFFEFGDFF
jgi:hypothetical protein